MCEDQALSRDARISKGKLSLQSATWRAFRDVPSDDRLCPGAVLDHAGEDFTAAFEQSDDGRLAAGSASRRGPKIGLVNLDFHQ